MNILYFFLAFIILVVIILVLLVLFCINAKDLDIDPHGYDDHWEWGEEDYTGETKWNLFKNKTDKD